MINVNYIKTLKTARYSTWGNLTSETKYFWFALHGSKMLSEQMLYKFKDFDADEHFVVAPEAMNRFYANGFGGDVVASWMTSRDRLDEIDDFNGYLSNLYSKYEGQLSDECKKIVFGFSQGGTTLFRWLNGKVVACDHVLGYSCWFPEDIDLKESKTELQGRDLIYTFGRQDQFLTKDRINALKDVIKINDLNVTIEEYDGDHRVDRQQLNQLFQKYFSV